MKIFFIFFVLYGLVAEIVSWSIDESVQTNSICSWMIQPRVTQCSKDEFQCVNSDKCIRRSWYCDRGDDCGDDSDEKYCSTSSLCPTDPLFAKCDNSNKCIPYEWICNGYSDCPNGDDENDCGNSYTTESYYRYSTSTSYDSTEGSTGTPITSRVAQFTPLRTKNALENIANWLQDRKLKSSSEKWGPYVDRIALLFYFTTLSEAIEPEIAYELNIQMLSRLSSSKLEDISSTELASYVNAFLVTCKNPRDFYGHDIIQELRNRVNQEEYTNPYVYLAMCNAGEIITEADRDKLIDIFYSNRRTFWADIQAVVVMALACAKKQSGNEAISDTLIAMALELKQRQQLNGTIDNLPTTALVLQALIAMDSEKDPENFAERNALQIILQNQNSDGSFGDLMSTIFVAPILTCRSFMHIDTSRCHYENRDEISALEELSIRTGSKIPVQYSLWYGDEKDLERNVILRVPENTSLYGVMEVAAEVDSRFKFDYSVKNTKPYVNAISGMRDNPLVGKYWFLYTVEDGVPELSNESPADIIPIENGHYVLWYRRGTWVE